MQKGIFQVCDQWEKLVGSLDLTCRLYKKKMPQSCGILVCYIPYRYSVMCLFVVIIICIVIFKSIIIIVFIIITASTGSDSENERNNG